MEEFDVTINKNVMVPMRDNIKLATDIYIPSVEHSVNDKSSFPCLLIRTPYNKESQTSFGCVLQHGEYFAKNGFIVVCQDVRGMHKSEGVFRFLIQEPEDGYDTVEWIAQQKWCNGQVATIGCSYLAWVQMALATLNPPHLSAMFVMEGGSRGFTNSVRNGGALELRWFAWQFFSFAEGHPDVKVREMCNKLNVKTFLDCDRNSIIHPNDNFLHLPSESFDVFTNLFTNGCFDEFWRSKGLDFLGNNDNFPNIPIIFISGWYDSYSRAMPEMFQALRSRNNVSLLMGPWVHGPLQSDQTVSGEIEFGDACSLNYFEFSLDWLREALNINTKVSKKRKLMGYENIMNMKKVSYFLMGSGTGLLNTSGKIEHGGEWRYSDDWPPKEYSPHRFYFDVTSDKKMYILSHNLPENKFNCETSYTYDPLFPVPTIGGNISSLSAYRDKLKYHDIPPCQREKTFISPSGGWDQIERPSFFCCSNTGFPLCERKDVISFTSLPLESDIEVAGPVAVTLYISTDAKDTDFTAKLVHVYPNGYSINICDGIRRLRYSHSEICEKEEFLKPYVKYGKSYDKILEPSSNDSHDYIPVHEININLYPTANVFPVGHLIRVDISSSNFPRFDLNPNTGESMWQNTHTKPANNVIHHSMQFPSHIEVYCKNN